MTPTHRDLSTPELWERSLARSRLRRALAPRARREHKRRKGLSAAAAAATMAGPGAPMAFAQVAGGDLQAEVAAETTSARAIEVREGGLPLQYGSQGELVAHVQRALEIPADGVFGGQTDTAVRQYQMRSGLQVDGIVGPATWASLFESGSAVGGSNVSPQVKERIAQKLVSAGRRIDAQAASVQTADLRETSTDRAGGSTGTGGAPELQASLPTGGGDSDDVPAGGQSDTPSAGGGLEGVTPVRGACGSTVSTPVSGTVTSEFGPRWGRNHDGVDIAAPSGTPVRAAACGSVTMAGTQSGYGNIVCITHTNQFSTCYAHLSRFATSQGAQVQQGQVIGYVGCTGTCTGPHVHFETRVNGQAQDPRRYMNGASLPGTSARTARSATAIGGPDLQAGRRAKQPSMTVTTSTSGGAVAAESLETREAAAMAAVGPTSPTEAPATSEAMTTSAPPPPAEAVQMPAPVPTDPAAAPVDATGVPVETAVPVDPAAPVETAVPAEAAPAPVDPAAVPVETAVPAEPAPVPVEAAPAPVPAPAPAPAPVEAAPAPAPAPVEAAPAPAPAPVPAPVEAAPAPAPAPVEAAPAPAPAPVEAAPAPAPAPVEPAPAPVEPAPAPVPAEPAPAETAPPVDPAVAGDASASGAVTTDTGGAAAPVQ